VRGVETVERDRRVRRVLWIEGSANLAVLCAKAVVGVATGSTAVIGDAIHSFADLSNNAMAMVAVRVAAAPPDREHPYGHRKFETLAVFALAVLLSVLAIEVALRSIERSDRSVARHGWSLAVMLSVLAVNTSLSLWQRRCARRLDSEILRADANHTLSDVFVTIGVIAGWQFAAAGHGWLDTATTLAVSGLILYLAWGLFRRAIPVLVDQTVTDPDAVRAVVDAVAGVRSTRRVRSRDAGSERKIDVVVGVDAALSTEESHRIADEIERALEHHFSARDVTVHVEPDVRGDSR
jgi:cation diffusion facilitator family transporter